MASLKQLRILAAGFVFLLPGCSGLGPTLGSSASAPGGKDEIAMSHRLTSNDWETLDVLWGVNVPKRHIWVNVSGYRLRVKKGPLADDGSVTPGCVNYGGPAALVGTTVEIRGTNGNTVPFLQGVGDC